MYDRMLALGVSLPISQRRGHMYLWTMPGCHSWTTLVQEYTRQVLIYLGIFAAVLLLALLVTSVCSYGAEALIVSAVKSLWVDIHDKTGCPHGRHLVLVWRDDYSFP